MQAGTRPLTGRAVLAVTLTAFATVIGVNVAMAVLALRSFPGLEAPNAYVASRGFDAAVRAQDALGWTASVALADGRIALRFAGADGAPVHPVAVAASATRPTVARDDRVLDLTHDGAAYTAPAALAPGRWRIRIAATAADGTPFRTVRDVTVPDAAAGAAP